MLPAGSEDANLSLPSFSGQPSRARPRLSAPCRAGTLPPWRVASAQTSGRSSALRIPMCLSVRSADALRRDRLAQFVAYRTERRRKVPALSHDVGHLRDAKQIRRNLHVGIVLTNQEHSPSVENTH